MRRRHRTEQQHKNRYPGATTEVARRRLAVVARDLSRLIRLFEKDKEIASWAEFATLRRVLAEQCEVLPEPQQPRPDDEDLDLDFRDMAAYYACYTGEGAADAPLTPPSAFRFDADGDSDVDAAAFELMLEVVTGPRGRLFGGE